MTAYRIAVLDGNSPRLSALSFFSTTPDVNRHQLPRSPEACRPAECCHCCQLPSEGGRSMNQEDITSECPERYQLPEAQKPATS